MVTASSICKRRTLELERENTLWLKAGLLFLKHLKSQRCHAERNCSGEKRTWLYVNKVKRAL